LFLKNCGYGDIRSLTIVPSFVARCPWLASVDTNEANLDYQSHSRQTDTLWSESPTLHPEISPDIESSCIWIPLSLAYLSNVSEQPPFQK
jgi:hypothetical protein